MWKETLAFIKSAVSSYKRLSDAEEDVTTLQDHVGRQDDDIDGVKKALTQTLFEFEKVIMRLENDRQIAGRDYENLVLRLQLAMKDNDQRALPPGSIPQNAPDLQAQIDALKQEVEELKTQFAEWKAR